MLPLPLPPPAVNSLLFHVIESLAVYVGALGGALAARRDRSYHFDFIGIIGLALISGVGGGLARDIILQRGLPLAFSNPHYLSLALAGAITGLLFGSSVGKRILQTINIIDAASLGLFSVAGATRAQNAGLAFLPALLLGVTTAVGGGALRDVFSGRTPSVFLRGEPYAIVAAFAAAAFLVAERLGFSPETASTIGSLGGFILRLLSIHFGWRTDSVAQTSPAPRK